ncbi:hypothetical protein KGF57_004923 [Candida theae]|uniref:Uncharacterized protein n=1 Tax=Candida theae TaxID=1198502 RepID=A0AAD5FWN2_9ASCO|nr:uncharacterized protein KGF57_004923 [Candida theae]KAI5949093.1 hypothetical protein KGF57_004923 [Candida theae]
MQSRTNKAPKSGTDYSSESESFFSTLLGKSQETQPTQTKISKESAILIQSAARLELESITLKESLAKANESIEKFSKMPFHELLESINQVKKDLAEMRAETNTNQSHLQTGLQKVAVNTELVDLISKSTTSQEKVCHIVDENIQALGSSAEKILAETSSIHDKQQHQNHTIGSISDHLVSLDDGIKDIKQFLSLLLPRLITVEKLVVSLQSQTQATLASSKDNESPGKPKRRRLE